MPNRMLRDWTNSDRVDIITAQSEVFFVRLIMKADDHGCFWADPKRLKSNLFPLKSDSIREADISRWMAECQKAGLLVSYESDDKKYLQIVEFGQRLRTKKSKFPLPHDRMLPTNDRNMPLEVEEEVEEKEANMRAHDFKESNLFRKPVIPTKQQVWEAIVNAGGTKEMAKSFWLKHEATGWFINGSPVVSYSALAQKFVANWKTKDENDNHSSAPPLEIVKHV